MRRLLNRMEFSEAWYSELMGVLDQSKVKGLRSLISRLQLSDAWYSGIMGILIGSLAGGGVWLFKRLIDLANWAAFTELGGLLGFMGRWHVIVLPVVGGLIVGIITFIWIGEERHHGVAGIIESVALTGGRLRYKRLPAKALVSAISIGSGGSVGPEDPAVQIGSNIASMFGQSMHLSDDRTRTLVAAGAAAGIAAAFNAPIAGVFFGLEVILGEIGSSALGTVVITAVASAVVTQALSGAEPAFHVPAYSYNTVLQWPFYVVLGFLAGPVAAAYVRLVYISQDAFHSIKMPVWAKPVIAGIAVGGVGVFLPQVFGVGYDTIGKILQNDNLAIGTLVALLIGKTILTPVSLGGGFRGGVFAPSLFLGATLGGAYGMLAARIFPGLNIMPPTFAMVGMAAVLAGSVHAPLTAILLLFEMTSDYRIILPLMFAVTVALFISQIMQRESVYTLGLVRKGIHLERGRDVEVLETVTVGEIMQTKVDSVFELDTLTKAYNVFEKSHHHGMTVLDDRGGLVGIITLHDLEKANPDNWGVMRVGDVCTHELLTTYTDETIGSALRKMGAEDIGRLPVVARDNPHQLVGVLRRTDLVRAYDTALTRRETLRHRVQQVRLDAVTPERVKITEVVVEDGAPCAGKRIREVPLPPDCLIVSLRRGRQVLIPHGNTAIKPGDTIVVVAEEKDREQLLDLFMCMGDQSS